tara:strand:+ start:2252 stop:2527 length:276 start_codon:yes stop_codon:yes gene_type:complete
MYYIISKIELIDDEVVQGPIGYTISEDDINSIEDELNLFTNWVVYNSDKLTSGEYNIYQFFSGYTNVHQLGWVTDCIDGLDVPLITDINNL